jgi:hypothetical protein
VTVGCDFRIDDEAQIPAALDKIEQALTPATAEQCEGWLVMLQAATAHRADTGATSAVAYSLYASELRQWPADVAKSVCERFARGKAGYTGTNWFPTLAELVSELERAASQRKAMYEALRNWAPPALPHANDRRFGEGPSEEEKAAVHRMAEEARASLIEAARRVRPARKAGEMPSTAGKPDAGGLTPEMRELMARREG